MKESKARRIHTRNVVAGLDELLGPRSFVLPGKARRAGKYWVRVWRRDIGWKIDIVQYTTRVGTGGSFMLGLGVDIPDKKQGIERDFDGKGVPYILGRSEVGFRMPNILGRTVSWSSERFAIRVCKDLAKALVWFDKFETPKKCLVQLETGRTNGAGKKGGKAYRWFEAYFEELLSSNEDQSG